MSRPLAPALLTLLTLLSPIGGRADDEPAITRTEDVIYGRKFGIALTMDVFTPKKDANGPGVILVVSGGWFSAHEAIGPSRSSSRCSTAGYTVFAVVHGSQPKFTIPEILEDMHRAVRFIRHHAKEYGIDPDRIGITGGSAGGHLSLMQGTAGDAGEPERQGPGRPGVEPGAGGRLLLPADRLPELRQAGRGRARPGHPRRTSRPRSTSTSWTTKTKAFERDHRRGEAPGDRPADLAGHPRHDGRPADADHPRRRGQAGADPAGRDRSSRSSRRRASRRSWWSSRARATAGRHRQGHDPLRRLVRQAPEEVGMRAEKREKRGSRYRGFPLRRRRGGAYSPSPPGRRCPEGADEGLGFDIDPA